MENQIKTLDRFKKVAKVFVLTDRFNKMGKKLDIKPLILLL